MLCMEEKEPVEVRNDEAQVMMLTLEVSDDQNKNSVEVYKDFIDTVKVNGKSVQSLYDTGATKAAIRQGWKRLTNTQENTPGVNLRMGQQLDTLSQRLRW